MKKVYANLLGKWTELEENTYSIDNKNPSEWIRDIYDYKHSFVWVYSDKTNESFEVHISNIQINSK